VIASGECGLVVPYGNPAALQAALERLQSDPGLRQRLGSNARRVYEQRYSWEIMRQRLLGLYASLQEAQDAR
jgi:glycosyltransferase involved in cell wall biosynthesis